MNFTKILIAILTVFTLSLQAKDIHFTHVAIAGIGAQWVQRWNNGDQIKDKMVINI